MEKTDINNEFYNDLGSKWLEANNHPVALLRAENNLRNPWIANKIKEELGTCKVLDIGCGGGFLTNFLATQGHSVQGVDLSESSLAVAQKSDMTGRVIYQKANAYDLPFLDETFDVVCAMDILEHVENPSLLIKEASRVLKPSGTFFFHTFNRNIISYLVAIKSVESFMPNTPKNMHVYPLFIKPRELKKMCAKHNLSIQDLKGVSPKVDKFFVKSFLLRKMDPNFSFVFSKSLKVGYSGFAKKEALK